MPAMTLVVRGSGLSIVSGLRAACAVRFSLRYVERAEFAATEWTQVETLLRPEYVPILVAMFSSASWAASSASAEYGSTLRQIRSTRG